MSEDQPLEPDELPEDYLSDKAVFANEDEKRAHHNALERKRRDQIKHWFDLLRDAVSIAEADASKVSRAEILTRATEYIKTMRKRNADYRQNIEDLQRQIKLLDTQINSLQPCGQRPQPGPAAASTKNDTITSNTNDDTDSDASEDEGQKPLK